MTKQVACLTCQIEYLLPIRVSVLGLIRHVKSECQSLQSTRLGSLATRSSLYPVRIASFRPYIVLEMSVRTFNRVSPEILPEILDFRRYFFLKTSLSQPTTYLIMNRIFNLVLIFRFGKWNREDSAGKLNLTDHVHKTAPLNGSHFLYELFLTDVLDVFSCLCL